MCVCAVGFGVACVCFSFFIHDYRIRNLIIIKVFSLCAGSFT